MRGQTDTARLFKYADLLAPEKEFFIRKAIGWALRDYAWHDWRVVERFLTASEGKFSGLTVREARKNFAILRGDFARTGCRNSFVTRARL
jgi:3-methyladenine DNA glycosylase AlkD